MQKLLFTTAIIFTYIMANAQLQPPVAEKKPKILEANGDKRTDDYYWMNDFWLKGPDSAHVVNYLKAENDYFDANMAATKPLQEKIYSEILGRIKQTDESVPYFKNGYWYITKTEEGKEYARYTRRKGIITAPEEVLLDANEEGAKYKYYGVGGVSVSPDNTLVAIGIDTVSRRKYYVRFKNISTGTFLPDEIPITTGRVTWANDNKTIFYTTKDDVTLRSNKVMKHILGTPSANDTVVFEEKDETFSVGVGKTKSEKYIMIQSHSTLSSEAQVLEADKPSGEFKVIQPREKNMLYDVDHYKENFYISTNWNAINFKLVKTPVNKTTRDNWVEVIPNRTDVLLDGFEIFNNFLVVNERTKANTQIRILPWTAKKEFNIDFEEPAYVAAIGYNPEFNTDELRYSYQSMTTPPGTYEYNMVSKTKKLLKQTEVLGGYNSKEYTTERLWATAKDGTKVPISVVYKNGFKKEGSQPLLLYGYGSYGASTDPTFSIARLSLLDRGFAFAIAHIRGGQEMGRQWYEDGKMFKKKNTFTDFIDCADFLIASKYTSPQHLYANGGSAGGLLMGAVVNMRPDLWHGVVAAVPFVDVVTTMLDESIPLTTGEFDEWGNPKNKDSYEYMKSYSPYDNVAKVAYPNMLVTTGLHDSQVQYFEPAKWVARLREMKTGDNLLLLHTNMDAGHGGASGRFQRLREVARDYSFFLMLEGIKD